MDILKLVQGLSDNNALDDKNIEDALQNWVTTVMRRALLLSNFENTKM